MTNPTPSSLSDLLFHRHLTCSKSKLTIRLRIAQILKRTVSLDYLCLAYRHDEMNIPTSNKTSFCLVRFRDANATLTNVVENRKSKIADDKIGNSIISQVADMLEPKFRRLIHHFVVRHFSNGDADNDICCRMSEIQDGGSQTGNKLRRNLKQP